MSITTAGTQCTDKPYSAIDMQWLCKMNCKLELNYRRMVIFRLFDIQGLLVIWIHFLHQTENNYVNMTNISVFFLKLSANSWSVWNEQLSILKKCNAFFRSYMTYFARCFLLFFFLKTKVCRFIWGMRFTMCQTFNHPLRYASCKTRGEYFEKTNLIHDATHLFLFGL